MVLPIRGRGAYQFSLSQPGCATWASRVLYSYKLTRVSLGDAFENEWRRLAYVMATKRRASMRWKVPRTYKNSAATENPAKTSGPFVAYDNQDPLNAAGARPSHFSEASQKRLRTSSSMHGFVTVWFGPTVPSVHENQLGTASGRLPPRATHAPNKPRMKEACPEAAAARVAAAARAVGWAATSVSRGARSSVGNIPVRRDTEQHCGADRYCAM